MADLVAPFQGERYAAADRLSVLIAPPYDVIDPAERARYAALDRDNIVHIMLPEAPPGAPEEERYRVAAEGYEPRRIRPHEHTHAGPKADRLALMRATATNIESIFLLAPDHDRALANAVAAASSARPDATAELNGVGIRLWIVRDPSRFPLSPSPLYIADGHHRYETASAYALENPAADRVLALIVSAQDPGLAVLPTHRVIFGTGRELERMLPHWREWFDVQTVPAGRDPVAVLTSLGSDRTACLVADRWRVIVLLLRPGAVADR